MTAKTTKGPHYESQLATNLRRLIDHTDGGSVNAWSARYGLQQTTVNRVANGTSDLSVGQLTRWSAAIGCPPECLIRSDFDPALVARIPDSRARTVADLFLSINVEADRQLLETLARRLCQIGPKGGDAPTDTKIATRTGDA